MSQQPDGDPSTRAHRDPSTRANGNPLTHGNPSTPANGNPLTRADCRRNWRWVWSDVAIPLVITRLALLLVAWFAQFLPADPNYFWPQGPARGWLVSTHRWLDVWGRWDSGWYMGVATTGYVVDDAGPNGQSNIAFFPLYPKLVRAISLGLPEHWRTNSAILLIGVAVSNVFLFGGLVLLYRLALSLLGSESQARRTVLYVLLFPSSFALSAFMTEGTFLFFSVAAFYAASKRAWAAAGVFGAGVALTRHVGVIILVPMVWMYLESVGWKLSAIRWRAAWLLLIPAAFFGYLASVYPLTGDLFGPLRAQGAWERHFTLPWKAFVHPAFGYIPNVTPVERVLCVVFVLAALASLVRLPSMGYGIYVLLLILAPLTTGAMIGFARYCGVMFPAFLMLARMGERPAVNRLVATLFLVFQVLFMVLWTRFYLIF